MGSFVFVFTGLNSPLNVGNNAFKDVTVCMGFKQNPGFRKPYIYDGCYWEPCKVDRYSFKNEDCNGYTERVNFYSFLN
jgi:hypothetical protein